MRSLLDKEATGSDAKMLRNGTIMVKANNKQHAKNLLQITEIFNGFMVKVEIHEKLNISKGKFYCKDLTFVDKNESTEDLKNQRVIRVIKCHKLYNNQKIPTGLFFVTFVKNAGLIGFGSIQLKVM